METNELVNLGGRSWPNGLALDIHYHMLFLDGVYADRQDVRTRFRCAHSRYEGLIC